MESGIFVKNVSKALPLENENGTPNDQLSPRELTITTGKYHCDGATESADVQAHHQAHSAGNR